MSQFTTVESALKGRVAVGQQVRVRGWLRSKRDSKAGISFLAVHDGSCFDAIQAVVPAALDNYESEILKLSTGCAVVVTGELVASQGKGQSVEIQASAVEVVGWVDDAETYPIAKKRHSFEYLRTQAHLRPRTNTIGAITRVRATLANAIHNYFYERGFYWINTPDYYRQRLRGRRGTVSCQYPGFCQPAPDRRAARWISARTFLPASPF